MYNSNDSFLDMLNAISLIIGMQNLKENREQSAHNDVQAANANQAKYLLAEISKQFKEQNKILSEQTNMLQEILNILKGESYAKRNNSYNRPAEKRDS